VADFIKTLSLEFTGVLSKVVDLDPFDPVPILRQKLIDELASDDDTLQAGLPGDRRLTVMPQLAPLADGKYREIRSDWVFLLTGGARGITAEIATMLARRHQPRLILAGTSPLPRPEAGETAGISDAAQLKNILTARLRAANTSVKPAEVEAAYQRLVKDREILHTLQLLRGYGTEVAYHAVDVRDESAFGDMIERIYRDYGRLDVVVHGAGIIEDKLIRDKTPESFDRVVHTKADSVFLLSRKLRPESLKCLVLMSSITAAFGNRAQSDYAAANGIMNGLSVALSAQWPCRVVAMNWGPWDPQSSGPRQAGMVSEETRQQFKVRGVQLIPAAAGAEAVLREIETGDSNDPLVTLGDGPWTEVALPAELDAQTAHALGGTS
jgi:NAD(P)-dependent dehydrogenase (short-subunit alcohol dehydrogenase family)